MKLLCDEVFGLNNLCGNIIWRKKSGGGQTDAFFVTEHEYILVYRKTDQFIWQDETVAISEDTFNCACSTRQPYFLLQVMNGAE